jgi:lipopolysaccharide transport system ATP-binding protein
MNAITVENVWKRYRKGQTGYHTLREDLYNLTGRLLDFGGEKKRDADTEHIWALRDVSFEVKPGERLGIIGRNGSGKTTLLRLLAGITRPTRGKIKVRGRLGVLIEIMAGFHPELTGRENIYLNGAIMGMSRKEIKRKFDEIVSFAELEEWIDTPIKRYSSGMHVRLGFAVAAHLDPDILLIDEVLAVGDAAFQKKCLGKMETSAQEGRTVLFVSHNMAAVEALCGRALLLEQGRLVMDNKTKAVIQDYLAFSHFLGVQPLSQRTDRQGNGKLKFTHVTFSSAKGAPTQIVQCGQDLEICVGYNGDENALRHVRLAIGIFVMSGQCMLLLDNQMVGTEFDLVPSVGQFSCTITNLPLAPGQYYLNLYCEVNGTIADWVQQAAFLTVEGGDFFGTGKLPPQTHGGMLVPQRWRVKTSEMKSDKS